MRCVAGIDLGSTTTKAVLLDEQRRVVGRGITNSRSNYEVAAAVAREEAVSAARFTLLERELARLAAGTAEARELALPLKEGFRLALYLDQLADLRAEIAHVVAEPIYEPWRSVLEPAVAIILDDAERSAPALFTAGARRASDFFRDLAGAAYMAGAERLAADGAIPLDRLLALYDRAILGVETHLELTPFGELLDRAAARLAAGRREAGRGDLGPLLAAAVAAVAGEPIETLSAVGTGYGRQTLPFPKEAVRSEILCHGRGAHSLFPGTRTVLDIGGQDTKAIQVDERGVVTSFQMNDRCAAGCGRYLGYIADELGLGLHELGPLALQARRTVKVNSTCTVFAGAELRERLALGERREDILAGLHRAIMLRAMSLLARSGGIADEFTFTGGVCKNPMATQALGELVRDNYGAAITINAHPDSIYMGALGAALFALEDLRAGRRHALAAGPGRAA
jgi:benzoyl-CoA reductase subunit A